MKRVTSKNDRLVILKGLISRKYKNFYKSTRKVHAMIWTFNMSTKGTCVKI
jgi:hypothetical protein